MTAPRLAAAGRKAQTQSLPQLIANVRSIFRNEIEKMMTKFRTANTDFYNGYVAARDCQSRREARRAEKPTPPTPVPPQP